MGEGFEPPREFLDRAWTLPEVAADPGWQARRDLVQRVHELGNIAMHTTATGADLEAISAEVDALRARLEQAGTRSFQTAWRDGTYFDEPERWTDRIWLVGDSNPSVPRLRMHAEGDTAVGTITFDDSCVGAPGWAHGGLVAAAFDQIMGYRLICDGLAVVTGRLTVDFLAPTRLHVPVRYEAVRIRSGERSVHVDARALCNGAEIAKATGIFVQVPPETFESSMGKAAAPARKGE